jgi:hypothetical protein
MTSQQGNDMSSEQSAELLRRIFFPYASRREDDLVRRNGRFVHYTSASVAMSILQRKEVWMRNATTMNDFSEMEYGHACLINAYDDKPGSDFKAALDKCHPDLRPEAETLFKGWSQVLKNGTYLTCISEHQDSEDTIGRLSMWRAYGGDSGVALVLNNKAFTSTSLALRTYSSPVAYFGIEEFKAHFQQVADSMNNHLAFLAQVDREHVKLCLFNMFRFAMLGTKHPGFREEREWRIIHTPRLEPTDRLLKDLQVVRGIPQTVYKIPLKNIPEEGLTGVEISEILDHVIIGPTQYPQTMYEAFVDILTGAGVPDAGRKIRVSDIPLRQG